MKEKVEEIHLKVYYSATQCRIELMNTNDILTTIYYQPPFLYLVYLVNFSFFILYLFMTIF